MGLLKILKKQFLKVVPESLRRRILSGSKSRHELSSGEVTFFHLIESLVSTVVDVGARTDTFYATARSTAKSSRKVFMFEANPYFAKLLENNTPRLNQDNFVFNVAIGKENDKLYYYYDTQSLVGKSKIGIESHYKSRNPIEVRTLDSFQDLFEDVDFLKTDIEEMDFYALLGAANLLPRVHFIQFELGLGLPFDGRFVSNQDYWDLLETNFDLFILQDEKNPIWRTQHKLALLLKLTPEMKKLIEILQDVGIGFNLVGINKNKGVPKSLKGHIGRMKI